VRSSAADAADGFTVALFQRTYRQPLLKTLLIQRACGNHPRYLPDGGAFA
jgi:hypothetical protein